MTSAPGEPLFLPGWVKPAVVVCIALLGAGASAGWIGATYAGAASGKLEEIRLAVRDAQRDIQATQREVCALREALNVPGTSAICGRPSLNHTALPALFPWLTVAPPPIAVQAEAPAIPVAALVTILAGLATACFLLGAGGFLLCWLEIVRLRRRVHDHDNALTVVYGTMDLPPRSPGGTR